MERAEQLISSFGGGLTSQLKVAILIGTCNGGRFLCDQLESIEKQTHSNWAVFASDDDSEDDTVRTLAAFRAKWGAHRILIRRGPGTGFARNFLGLVCDPNIEASYFAYCDQDDVWDTNKLSRALDWLRTVPPEVPALYCGRTRLINTEGLHIGYSPWFKKPPGFGNALVQSIAGGNTMVMNNAARAILQVAGPDVGVVSHDWWTYLAISACDGKIFYDPQPTVGYRQHEVNIIGMNTGYLPKLKRLRMLLNGTFKEYSEANLFALSKLAHLTSESSNEILVAFHAFRERPFRLWLSKRFKNDFQRQTPAGTFALFLAALFNKI